MYFGADIALGVVIALHYSAPAMDTRDFDAPRSLRYLCFLLITWFASTLWPEGTSGDDTERVATGVSTEANASARVAR